VVAHPAWRSVAYLLTWPGMDSSAFLNPQERASAPRFPQWVWAFLRTAFGITLFWLVARLVPAEKRLIQGWIGLFGLIFLLHFGIFDVLALLWQAIGVKAQPIMAAPIVSTSLSEFWGKRWNLGFRQLSYELLFRPLQKRAGIPMATMAVFVTSGLIHDLVISLPAQGGYGLPTAYFTLQGFGLLLERSQWGGRLGLNNGPGGKLFLFAFAGGPLFWLFHPPFVLNVIVPFMRVVRAL
jgi:alginate O-acetyltransferase complex protein AlgI